MRKRMAIYFVSIFTLALAAVASQAYITEASSTAPYWDYNSGKIYYNDGNVGIGTNIPAQPLDVAGDVEIGGGSTKYDGSSESIKLKAQSEDWYLSVMNNALSTSSAFFIGLASGDDDVFNIATNGQVGIGTNQPNTKLTVAGNIRSIAETQILLNTETSGPNIRFGDTTDSDKYLQIGAYSGYNNIDTKYRSLNIFSDNASNALFINANNGNIGMGTSSPSSELDMYGSSPNLEISNTDETNGGIIFNDAQAQDSQYAKIQFNSGDHDLDFLINGSTPIMTIEPSGQVGIGTTNPAAKLEIGNSGDLLLKASVADPGDIIFQTSSGTQKGRIWATPDKKELNLSSGDNYPDIVIRADGEICLGKC